MCRKMGKGHEDATSKSRFTKVYAKLFNFSYSLFVKNTNVLYMFSIFHLISSLPLNFYDYFSDKEFFPSIVRLLNSSLYGAGF